MQQVKFFLLLTVLVGCFGCSALMPYDSSFKCPSTYKGKCVTMEEAYNESLSGNSPMPEDEKTRKRKRKKDNENNATFLPAKETNKDLYRDNLYLELAGLIKDPVTPVMVPPKVMRALVLPYPDGKELFMPRYTYMMVDDPTWVVDTYLLGDKKKGRE